MFLNDMKPVLVFKYMFLNTPQVLSVVVRGHILNMDLITLLEENTLFRPLVVVSPETDQHLDNHVSCDVSH